MPAPRIGTSGYVYPHWRGRFYPAGLPARAWFEFYAERFDTVELNTTFYRLPTEKGVKGWAEQAPRGFLFAVKGSRYLTHLKRLKDPGQGLERFFEALAPLRRRVGPVLWQLPPQMKPDLGRLDAFLQALPRGFEHVVEPRDEAWYGEALYALLEDRGASLCLHDLVEIEAPFPPPGSIYYRRFHGARGKYGGRYGPSRLAPTAREIERLASRGVPCFAYFNNDRDADALADAWALRRLVGASPARGSSATPALV